MNKYIGISKPLNVVRGRNANLDAKYGPYDTLNHAIIQLPEAIRKVGLTVGIITIKDEVETINEYWWKEGTSDNHLVKKVWEFKDLSEEEKDELKLYFEDLSPEEKFELKLKFEDLTPSDKLELKGAKGDTGDPLTVRKTYQTEAEALADKNPIDTTTSLPLTVGQFVSIVNDGEKNGIYRIGSIDGSGTMSLELQGKLGDLSVYATKEETKDLPAILDRDIKIENAVENSDFSEVIDGIAVGFSKNTAVYDTRVADSRQYFKSTTAGGTSSSMLYNLPPEFIGDDIFMYISEYKDIAIRAGDDDFSNIENGIIAKNISNRLIQFRATVVDEEVFFGKITVINLTKTFGEGYNISEKILGDFMNNLPNRYFKGYSKGNQLISSLLGNDSTLKQNIDDVKQELNEKFGEPNIIWTQVKNLYKENTTTLDDGLTPRANSESSGYIKVNVGDVINVSGTYTSQISFYNEAKTERVRVFTPAIAPEGYPYAAILYSNNGEYYPNGWVQIIPVDDARKISAKETNFIVNTPTADKTKVESALVSYKRAKGHPKVIVGSNILNKDNTVNGIVGTVGTGGNVTVGENSGYKTNVIYIDDSVTHITSFGVRKFGYADINNKAITNIGVTTPINEARTSIVPEGTSYIYASIPIAMLDVAQISVGETLLAYEPYSFTLEYNGKQISGGEGGTTPEPKTVDLQKVHSDFETGGIAAVGGFSSSRNRARVLVNLEEGITYDFELENCEKVNSFYQETDDSWVRENSNTAIGTATRRKFWFTVTKADNSDITESEMAEFKLTATFAKRLDAIVYELEDKIDTIEGRLGSDNLGEIYEKNALLIENEVLRKEAEIQSENLDSLLKAKNGNPQDSQTISLNRSTGGKFILGLHKRVNNGFNVENDAYLPNANKDFSDVRIIGDDGSYLPYRTIYNGNIDIIPDRRVPGQTIMFTDNNNSILASVGRTISKSDDGGYTWTPIPIFDDGTNSYNIILVSQQDTILAGSAGKIYRSEFPYTTKTMVRDMNLEYAGSTVKSRSTRQHPDGEIFFGAYQDEFSIRIYKSVDDGATWVLSYENDVNQHVHGMYVDTNQTPVAIYAGLDGGGFDIVRTTDKGSTWVSLRGLNPEMPTAMDAGISYAGDGYRLFGGETAIVGGYSITKTTDDLTYKAVLKNGNHVPQIEKLGDKLFAGGAGSWAFRTGQILLSEDEAETWKTIYTTSWIDEGGANDGFRYISKMPSGVEGEMQILAGCQSQTRSSLRIFEGGDNWYSQIIVDVPSGVNSVTVESGYLISNKKLIYNDSKTDKNILVNIPLNENSDVIKVQDSNRVSYIDKSFEFVEMGKKLGQLYPYVTDVRNRFSAKLKMYDSITVNADLSQGNFSIGFWYYRGLEDVPHSVLNVIRKGDSLLSFVNHQIQMNGTIISTGLYPNVSSFDRVDINITPDGDFELFINGSNQTPSETLNLLPEISSWKGDLTVLEVPYYREGGVYKIVQGFKIIEGNITHEEALNNYYNGMFDNME